jgi:hypothetical protein
MSLTCQKCGGEMPPLPDDLATMMRSAGGVQLVHDLCPGEKPVALEGRYFEVRVQIVEVTEPVDVDPDPDAAGAFDPIVAELVDFRYGTRAANLDAAMRPLAEGLGEKWMAAEKHAAIADPAGGGE